MRSRASYCYVTLVAWLYAAPAASASAQARLVEVMDGDTVSITVEGNTRTVDLAEVAAPVTGQPFADNAKKALSSLLRDQDVRIEGEADSNRQRILFLVKGKEKDASVEMLRMGWAWVDRKTVQHRELYTAEGQARSAKKGIWSSADALPPWEWAAGRRPLRYAESKLTGLIVGDSRSQLYYPSQCDGSKVPVEYRVLFVRVKEAEKMGYRASSKCP
jgi:endonuclease YncB( thermonuclease family)